MRLNPYATRPEPYRALLGVAKELASGPLEASLRALVEVRVSQINGCGFCLAMHADQARSAGVPQSKLDTVAGWAEDVSFSDREQAALAIAEAVTVLAHGVSDELWDRAAAVFSDEELADLLYVVGVINLYNRLNVASGFPADFWRDHGIHGIRPS